MYNETIYNINNVINVYKYFFALSVIHFICDYNCNISFLLTNCDRMDVIRNLENGRTIRYLPKTHVIHYDVSMRNSDFRNFVRVEFRRR